MKEKKTGDMLQVFFHLNIDKMSGYYRLHVTAVYSSLSVCSAVSGLLIWMDPGL